MLLAGASRSSADYFQSNHVVNARALPGLVTRVASLGVEAGAARQLRAELEEGARKLAEQTAAA